MWDTYNEDNAPKSDVGRLVRIIVVAGLGVVIFAIVSNLSVNLFMNVIEFEEIFTKPLYYAILSGTILASIALVRVNFKNRRSMVWYGIRLLINFLRKNQYDSSHIILKYSDFTMHKSSFAIWQLTKVVIMTPLLANMIFGMAVVYFLEGNDLGVGSLLNIFTLPFANTPLGEDFAEQNVTPMIPALTLLIPPLLSVIWLRIFLYIGVSGAITIGSQYISDTSEGKPKLLSYISTVEIIIGAALIWMAFNMFFTSYIDYNTKFAIAGTLILGFAFIGFAIFDKRRSRVIVYPHRKQLYLRILTALLVAGATGSIMTVNNSIADAKKIEWMGPYVSQEIAINRYIAEIENVDIVNYDVKPPSVSPAQIQNLVLDNKDTLDNIRLWDQQAADLKLKPELGQKNDINFADTDIIRFDGDMYWAAPTTPNLPADVTPENRWYNQHMVYTHVNRGILMLEADTGNVIDSSKYFTEKRIYYGESGQTGLFDEAWSSFPVGRTTSDEIDQFFYDGTGGIDVLPPLSWIFEPNFMLSYPDVSIHVMRFKDIHERMELMYPYFIYRFGTVSAINDIDVRRIDVIPVTDGKSTFMLMPLIINLDTSHVPWSTGNMLRLVGYGLINTYDGEVQLIINGDDPFSRMFKKQYSSEDIHTEVPQWLNDQIKYPEEMFIWKISKFNQYHVTDPKTFIEAKQFYQMPADVPTYFIITKPPGFNNSEFVGFQSLELRNSPAKNLVGYMIVQNDIANLGKMTFYSIPLDSNIKLLGPSAAREALEKDPVYAKEKTLLRNPRVGENILYRIGDQEVYFIPVYTSSTSGGVVTQLGTIATVGGAVTGNFYVGLGNNPRDAFQDYLRKVSGLTTVEQGNQTVLDRSTRIANLEQIFTDVGFEIAKPSSISVPLEFKESESRYLFDSDFAESKALILKFISELEPSEGRIIEWEREDEINFGFIRSLNNVPEIHYVSINVG